MAQIIETNISVKFSKIVRDSEYSEAERNFTDIIDSEQIEAILQELIGNSVIVEVDK